MSGDRVGQVPYEIVRDAPPSMSPSVYAELVRQEWAEFLARGPATEVEVQQFLEKHPCLVPFPEGVGPVAQGRGAHSVHMMVVTQPVLPGIDRPRPDFLRLNRDSEAIYATLIEIEPPSKRYARKDGQATAEYTQALSQIGDWKAWFAEPRNVMAFRDLYRLNDSAHAHRLLETRFVLVYGRRSELESHRRARDLRSMLKPPHTTVMSYDRLFASERAAWDLCVRLEHRAFVAETIPPTLIVGPAVADELAAIDRKEEALEASPHFDPARKAFLAQRLAYWDAWSRQHGGMRFYGADDLE